MIVGSIENLPDMILVRRSYLLTDNLPCSEKVPMNTHKKQEMPYEQMLLINEQTHYLTFKLKI